jgi:hypothetical protein
MVRHGDSSKEELYEMLRSADVRRRHLAFDLLEASNAELRENKAVFLRVLRFIWDATVSYDVCRDFATRHSRMLIELQRERLHAETERQHHPQAGPPKQRFFERLFEHSS